MRDWLEALEATLADAGDDDVLVAAAYAAGQTVEIDPAELSAARRRAMLVLAAGGDPHRPLDLGARAVDTLARDLDDPDARAELEAAVLRAAAQARDLPRVAAALARLIGDADLAWRAFACALLADEIADADAD